MLVRSPYNFRRIGLLVKPDLGVRREILRGVAQFAETEPRWELELLWKVTELRDFRPDSHFHGLIAWPEHDRDPAVIRSFAVPTVCMGHFPIEGVSRVLYDNRRIGARIAAYLFERGLKYFAAYAERLFASYSRERVEGFQNGLPAAGLPCPVFDARAVGENPERWEKLMPEVGAWLRDLPKPVGILADSDTSGYNLLLACRHFGVRVPDEVAVVSVGADDLVSALAQPRLSSASLNGIRAGVMACELLKRLLIGRTKPRSVWMDDQPIIERGSSNLLAFHDPVVVQAQRFLLDHATEEIQISDIVRAVGVSRRALEKRYKTAVGKTLHDTIQQCRLEKAQELLTQTQLPIAEIAERSGFSEARRLSEVFRRANGQTPRQYRNTHAFL